MKATLRAECQQRGIPLTDAQIEQFCTFGAELLEKNRVMNLTAITEPEAVARLHLPTAFPC